MEKNTLFSFIKYWNSWVWGQHTLLWQDVLQDTLTNQLLTFPPWQEVLWRETGAVYLSGHRKKSPPVLSYLAVLFEQDYCPVVDLELAVVLQTSHLREEMTSPSDQRKGMSPGVCPGGPGEHLERSRGANWPQYRDSSEASYPAWCPGRRLRPPSAWSWPETFYTGWTIAAGTRTNTEKVTTRNILASVCYSV